ncbi:FAD-dependent oxidoreductase [Occallatibacter savannae]|uniref:FAD-dependent oxidoreductase n=1 Tax=Occallatibacter savannae TaxID=1002691 RepID=UPI000D692791|nr:FAD-dependent oxidoreductase [Occallatibacter savannae]
MKTSRKIVIVGGVAGGASAAARARRVDENAEIHIFERGPYISFANCGLPYFIGGEIQDRSRLLIMTPEKMWARSRVQAHVNHEVISIDRAAKTIRVRRPDGTEQDVSYDKLILSQGARPIVPPIPGADLPNVFTLRDVPDMDRIVAFLETQRPKTAAVIGGGFIGLEMAEAFHRRGMHVTIIERFPHILPLLDSDMAADLQNHLYGRGLDLKTSAEARALTAQGVELADGSLIPAELILLSVGVKADVGLAREAGIEIGVTGGVKTNARMESSDPDIYAVGDAAETTHALTGARTRIPLAGPANRQGRIAGSNAAGGHFTYPGALGTSIVRILHMMAATTGLSSAQAAKAGLTFFTSVTRDNSHAGYYPGSKPTVIKVVAEEGTGRLLGAQIVGEEGVDKRIDVLSTAIAARMSVFDLENLDLAYAPPFGSANDPINVAGFVADHIVRGDISSISPDEWKRNGEFLLDVRDPEELARFGSLEDAVNIPLHELREHLSELPRDRKILVYCQKGQRGYLAACALKGSGLDNVINLRGGFAQAQLQGCVLEPEPSADRLVCKV